jgi:hypothetical protein
MEFTMETLVKIEQKILKTKKEAEDAYNDGDWTTSNYLRGVTKGMQQIRDIVIHNMVKV